MRVIEKGKYRDKVYRMACPECDSILEYTDADIHLVQKVEKKALSCTSYGFLKPKTSQFYDSVEYYVVTCPVCGYDHIELSPLPRVVKTWKE